MEPRVILILGIATLLVAMFYLEKQLEQEEVFYLFVALGIIFGIASLIAVFKNLTSFEYFIAGAVVSILIAILYWKED